MPLPSTSSSPLTVLFAPASVCIDEAQGGGEYYLPYKLMERLALDHGVRIIALTVQTRIEHHVPNVQFVSVDPGGPLPTSNLERLRFHLRCAAKARQLLADHRRIDIIHHMFPFGYRTTFNLLALLRRCSDPPIVIGPLLPRHSFTGNDEAQVSIREFKTSQAPVPPMRSFRTSMPPFPLLVTAPALSMLSSATLRRADALVAISERAVQAYRPLIGPQQPTVIPFGVDTDVFAPRPHDTHAADKGMPLTILAVGYLVRRKAFDVLVRAMAELVKVQAPVHLRIVGDGPGRANLETLIRHLGIEQHVTLAGLVPHNKIVSEYHRADIFCSPSLSEGFATVSLEALSCGLPIVTTPTGGFREALAHADVGTLVRFNDAEALASALLRYVRDPNLRMRVSHQARELAVREYDWRVIAGRYLSLYERVLHQHHGS